MSWLLRAGGTSVDYPSFEAAARAWEQVTDDAIWSASLTWTGADDTWDVDPLGAAMALEVIRKGIPADVVCKAMREEQKRSDAYTEACRKLGAACARSLDDTIRKVLSEPS